MSGATDFNHYGRVDTAELAEYPRKLMRELPATLKDQQEPQFLKGRDTETFPLGRYCERT